VTAAGSRVAGQVTSSGIAGTTATVLGQPLTTAGATVAALGQPLATVAGRVAVGAGSIPGTIGATAGAAPGRPSSAFVAPSNVKATQQSRSAAGVPSGPSFVLAAASGPGSGQPLSSSPTIAPLAIRGTGASATAKSVSILAGAATIAAAGSAAAIDFLNQLGMAAGGSPAGRAPADLPQQRGPSPWLPGSGLSDSPGGGGAGFLLLLLGALAGTLIWAAPRLGRWFRPTPDLVPLRRPVPLEVPG
jgi:hypothetical protein